MLKKIIYFLTLTIIILVSGIVYSDARLDSIYKKALAKEANKGKAIAITQDEMDIGYGSQDAKMIMVLINAQGEEINREMISERIEVNDDNYSDYSRIEFKKPSDVSGTKLLTHERKTGSDDQWLYLPAMNRIKRISSDNKSGSFMGSEFSYEDLGSREVEKYKYKYIRDTKLNGIDCFLVERYPLERSSGYTKMVSWVRKDNYQAIKIDFYDRKREHLKTLHLKDYKQYKGKFWRALTLEMENLQTGKKTKLKMVNLNIGGSLNKSKFYMRALGK
ncbi:MAG: outer membrane lipoprotein-sorting protein [Spirochaetota bacterium]|nr:outer membrane lipoprotein-sorting protein [Spirochaetota bacterium]